MFKDFLIFNGYWKLFNRFAGGWGYFEARVIKDHIAPEYYYNFIITNSLERTYGDSKKEMWALYKGKQGWIKILEYKNNRRLATKMNLMKKIKKDLLKIIYEKDSEVEYARKAVTVKNPRFFFGMVWSLSRAYPELKSPAFYKLRELLGM